MIIHFLINIRGVYFLNLGRITSYTPSGPGDIGFDVFRDGGASVRFIISKS